MFEIILRVAVLYLLLILSMRLLGKRMAAQLTRNELAAMSSLAAAIGLPILAPDRGLIPPFIMAVVVVGISRAIAHLTAKRPRVESITQGKMDTLVKDGMLVPAAMLKTRITKDRILAQLRSESIFHLGEVKRLYIEANGSFTMIKSLHPTAGLSVIPEDDAQFLNELPMNGIQVCCGCGYQNKNNDTPGTCPNCGSTDWTAAVDVEVPDHELTT